MKKPILGVLIGLLLFTAFVDAQTKKTSETGTSPVKTNASNAKADTAGNSNKPKATDASKKSIAQQADALIKAIIDSANAKSPKVSTSKITYGRVTIKPANIPVYEPGGDKLLMLPKLTQSDLDKIKSGELKLSDDQLYARFQIDTAIVTFKKNMISAIQVVSPAEGTAVYLGEIDPHHISDNDTITVTVQNKPAVIKVKDFLSFLWFAVDDDNLESGTKTLTSKKLIIPITGY